MPGDKTPNIPQSVIDKLARATLKAMREDYARKEKARADAQAAPASTPERRSKCPNT